MKHNERHIWTAIMNGWNKEWMTEVMKLLIINEWNSKEIKTGIHDKKEKTKNGNNIKRQWQKRKKTKPQPQTQETTVYKRQTK